MSKGNDQTGVLKRRFEVLNQYGIHARPAAMIVKIASRYQADVQVEKDGNSVSGKSIMGLMTLEASRGSRITVTARGPDADQVLDEIEDAIARRFDEEWP